MTIPAFPDSSPSLLEVLHVRFLALAPRIELHGRIFFRHIPCRQKRDDAVQEMVALCWKWFVRLALQGKDPAQFSSALARFAALAVHSGRRLCGQENSKDVLSVVAQRRHRFVIETLADGSDHRGDVLAEALRDNTRSAVPDQVAFRFDFPAWQRTRTDRDRRVMEDLLRGERTCDVSAKYGLTPTRISQLRREFHDDWARFCGEAAKDPDAATLA